MRKKLPFLLVILSLIFIAVGCTNEQVESENSLENYLNKDSQIIEEMKKQPIGATGPSLVYAHKQYAVILNFNGILMIRLHMIIALLRQKGDVCDYTYRLITYSGKIYAAGI